MLCWAEAGARVWLPMSLVVPTSTPRPSTAGPWVTTSRLTGEKVGSLRGEGDLSNLHGLL